MLLEVLPIKYLNPFMDLFEKLEIFLYRYMYAFLATHLSVFRNNYYGR